MANSRGINGLILAPQDSKNSVPVVQETVDLKIPVVIIDSGLDKPELMVKYVATNNFHGGELAAQHLLAVLAKEGKSAPKLAMLRYAVGSESTDQREKGFLAHVNAEIAKQKKAGKPAIEIVSDNVYSGATVDTAQAAAGPWLIRIKDNVDGIFAVNESATSGLLNAMRSQGLNKKIHLMGFDSAEALLDAVEQGDVDGLVIQDPYRMGYLGVWTLVRHLEGDDVSAGGKDLSTGEYLVTKDNSAKHANSRVVRARATGKVHDHDADLQKEMTTPARLVMRGMMRRFGANAGTGRRRSGGAPWRSPRPVGRERRRQIDADEGPQRRRPGRRRHDVPRRPALSSRRTRRMLAGEGVAMIYQELTLAPDLSVEANVLLGLEPQRWGFLNRREGRRRVRRGPGHAGTFRDRSRRARFADWPPPRNRSSRSPAPSCWTSACWCLTNRPVR